MPQSPRAEEPQPDTLIGYRLVRKLGSGSRADIFLAVGDVAEPQQSVALKLFHTSTTASSVAAEVEALARLDSPHCVRLVDYATDDSGRSVFVLTRAARGSVARLLALRGPIAAGEAVTILAPIAGAVAAFHDAGVVHSRIGAARVHFGDRGEPILLGFGHAYVVDAPADRRSAGFDTDREHLATLATFVLSAATQHGGESAEITSQATSRAADVEALHDWIHSTPRPLPAGFALDLQSRLFDLSAGRAVSFEPRGKSALRSATPAATALAVRSSVTPPSNSSPGGALASGWVDVALSASPFAPLVARTRTALRTRLPSAVRAVRPRFWAAAAALALAAAALLVPHESVPESKPRQAPEGASSTGPSATGNPGSQVDAEQPAAALPFDPTGLPEDPVVALPLLLEERARCYADLSVLCLDEVNQADSALTAEDTAAILQPTEENDPAEGTPESTRVAVVGRALEGPFLTSEAGLVERLGNAALVNVSATGNPASVLMIRTEAGWRLRELYGG
jgi:hypothetical protein